MGLTLGWATVHAHIPTAHPVRRRGINDALCASSIGYGLVGGHDAEHVRPRGGENDETAGSADCRFLRSLGLMRVWVLAMQRYQEYRARRVADLMSCISMAERWVSLLFTLLYG